MQSTFPVQSVKLYPHSWSRGPLQHLLVRLTVNGEISLFQCSKLDDAADCAHLIPGAQITLSHVSAVELLRYTQQLCGVIASLSLYSFREDLCIVVATYSRVVLYR